MPGATAEEGVCGCGEEKDAEEVAAEFMWRGDDGGLELLHLLQPEQHLLQPLLLW